MKTALVLAGGGSRGAYEMGVWQALREMGISIDVVTGTSIGAMNSALIAQNAFETGRDLWLSLKTEEIFDYKHALENKGVKFTTIKELLAQRLSEDAVRSSSIDMGICTVKFPSMEPVHLWKEEIPKGEFMDYVFASCSCFPVVMPYEIGGQSYVDGSFADYLPIGMALEKNPDRIIAVDLDGMGKWQEEDLKRAEGKLTMIRCHRDLGNFAVFDPSRSAKLVRLGYLDTMKAFGAFCGLKFTFFRGQFPAKNLKAMERAADNLCLDPGVIYSKDVFFDAIRKELEEYKSGNDESLALIKGEVKKFTGLLEGFKNINPLKGLVDGAKAKEARKNAEVEIENLKQYLKNLKIKDDAQATEELARKASFIALFEFIAKNFKGREIPSPLKKLLGDDLAAALWLTDEGFSEYL